ncbi:MAG TPA: cytochrome c oxidase assembly protein [Gemmatimonadales bacterium]|nr:cytochrome c oxidase assembly protein [Gemmatimonadales bacterium]
MLALLLGAGPLWAHEGRALAPHDFWGAWSFEPAVVLGLLVSGGLYARGMRELRRVARRRLLRREGRCFWSGWLLLALALVSPLHALGEALFAAHMAQHELIMAVAAPLLVLGRPLVVMLWAFPLASRRAIGALGRARALRGPWHLMSAAPVAFALHAAAILVWHLPRLYQWAVASETVHALQHTAFLVTALLFWWALLEGPRARLRYGAAVLYLFGTAVYTGGLGALLTVSRALWYPLYASRTGPWGFSPLEDQQLAGLIMWVPAGLAYLGAALALTAAWLREAEWRVARREAAPLLRGR